MIHPLFPLARDRFVPKLGSLTAQHRSEAPVRSHSTSAPEDASLPTTYHSQSDDHPKLMPSGSGIWVAFGCTLPEMSMPCTPLPSNLPSRPQASAKRNSSDRRPSGDPLRCRLVPVLWIRFGTDDPDWCHKSANRMYLCSFICILFLVEYFFTVHGTLS